MDFLRSGVGANSLGGQRRSAGSRLFCGNSPGIGIALQALEIGANLGGVLVPQFPIFLQRFVNDALKFGGDFGIEANGCWRSVMEYGIENVAGALTAKRRLRRDHFIEDGAE